MDANLQMKKKILIIWKLIFHLFRKLAFILYKSRLARVAARAPWPNTAHGVDRASPA